MIRTAFPRPREDDVEDVVWALSTARALWQKDHRQDALVWLQRASVAASETGEAFRAEELAHAARTLRVALEDEALKSVTEEPLDAPSLSTAPEAEGKGPITIPAAKDDDFLDPWAERTPARSFTPEPSVITSALPLEELRRYSKRPPPPPEEPEPSQTIPTWRPDAAEAPPSLPAMSAPALPAPPISLEGVAAFVDLPDDARVDLAHLARIEELTLEEEAPVVGLLLIIEGTASIQPTILDETAAFAKAGQVLYARGSLSRGFPLRVVAENEPVKLAIWSDEVIDLALASLPWVVDELRDEADRLQALAGAALGKLGERLDTSLREAVLDRLEVRVLGEGEVLAHEGQPTPGMVIVGAGTVELSQPTGAHLKLLPGDLLFPAEVLGAGPAPATARAGFGGAIVLAGNRAVSQELLVTWPPLLEVLAGM